MVRNPVLEVMLLDNNEPTSYGEAMVGPNSDKWLEAMKSEINGSLRRRRTWTVMLPSVKLDLWLRVFPQVQGVDCDETFLLVEILRVCWNYISSYCIIYEILQIGCQNIVSSTILEERLYGIQPEGFGYPEIC